jgi:WD40 repeat protein
MNQTGADRNLLFGILAIQMDFVSRDDLIAAMSAWAVAKAKSLGQILVEQGKLGQERHALLETLVQERLKQPGNDVGRCWAALPTLNTGGRNQGQPQDLNAPDGRIHTLVAVQHLNGTACATETLAAIPPASPGQRYQILRPHARGNLGEVFVAHDAELNREVALKEIQSFHAHNPESRARFVLEAEITGGLEHPGIVPVYGLGTYDDGRPYYTMRFIKGESLKAAIDDFHRPDSRPPDPCGRALALRRLLGRFLDVCNAMAYAHSRGVLHRDLKPSNVMLGKYGETLVVDWGLAKATGDRPEFSSLEGEFTLVPSSGSNAGATQMGSTIGTPAYMSPEQASGYIKDLSLASDVYSLGATLYHLLTGQAPCLSENVEETLRKVRRGEVVPPRRVNREVPPALEAICLKAMALEPAKRYASAHDLRQDLEHWLADEPVAAYRESLPTRLARWGRRHKSGVVGAVVLLASGVVALATSTVLIGRQEALAEAAQAEAVLSFRQAESARGKAEDERRRAECLAEESRRRLVRAYVGSGVRLLEQDNLLGSLVWFAEALRLDQGDAAREEVHRTRLAAVLERCPKLALVLLHDGPVSSADFSPDGRRMVTASYDHTARLWDAATGRLLATLRGHEDVVRWVKFSPDGSRVVTAGMDHTARVWNVETGQALLPPLRHENLVWKAVFSPDGRYVATASSDKTGRVWDAQTGRPVLPALKHDGVVFHIAFSPDGSLLATAGSDDTVRVWRSDTGAPVGAPLVHSDWAFCCSFSADGRRLATVSRDKQAHLWDVATGLRLLPPLEHSTLVLAARFNPDGKQVVTDTATETLRWDAATGKQLARAARVYPVQSSAGSPDGQRWIVWSGEDQAARVWETTHGGPASDLLPHGTATQHACFSPDGRLLLTAGGEAGKGEARIWEAESGAAVGLPLAHADRVGHASFSPDGQRVVTASEDRTARVWAAATGRPGTPPLKHDDEVVYAVFSPDGRHVVTTSHDQTARVWDARTGVEVLKLLHRDWVVQAAFSPDGRRLATASHDCTAIIWDTARGQELHRLKHGGWVRHVCFSPDGRRLLTASSDKRARLWDATTGQAVGKPLPHAGVVWSAAFSPDGLRIVTCSYDSTARIWDAATGDPATPPIRHKDAVYHASFSPDGRYVATASRDGTAQVWDAATGDPVSPPLAHGSDVWSVAFSKDGRRLVTASSDKTARIWHLARDDRSSEQWLLLTQLLTSRRIDAQGWCVPCPPGILEKALQARSANR